MIGRPQRPTPRTQLLQLLPLNRRHCNLMCCFLMRHQTPARTWMGGAATNPAAACISVVADGFIANCHLYIIVGIISSRAAVTISDVSTC